MKKKNIPNAITGIRIGLSPFIVPIIWSGHVLAGLLLFFTTALTDLIDGYLARKWDVQSVEGKYLDMVADKEFAFVILASTISISPMMLACLSLEGAIAYVGGKSFSKHHKTGSAFIGKVKTAVLSLAMGMTLAAPVIPELLSFTSVGPAVSELLYSILPVLIPVTLGFQTATLGHYIKHYKDEEKRLQEQAEEILTPTEEELTEVISKSDLAVRLTKINYINPKVRELYRTHLFHIYKEEFEVEKQFDNGLLESDEKEQTLMKRIEK